MNQFKIREPSDVEEVLEAVNAEIGKVVIGTASRWRTS
jgi:hypothetical protein